MVDSPVPEFPSETAMVENLLRSPDALGLSADQLAGLRVVSIDLQTKLIDASSLIRKVELRQQSGSPADNVAATIHDALSMAAEARAQALKEIGRILTAEQLRKALAAPATSLVGPVPAPAPTAGAKDQKVIEIETAVMIAERVLSWAKLFGLAVALPAAFLIAILTVVGIGKYSDFSALVAESQAKLTKDVEDATKNSASLAKKVTELAQQQSTNSEQIQSLSRQVQGLSFGKNSTLPADKQKQLQDLFAKFRDYLRGLGYVPDDKDINLDILDDANASMKGMLAYYQGGTIHVSLSGASDPDVIYREYLHHVLTTKVGTDFGIERSAIESGIADFFVGSYGNRPNIYQGTVPTNLAQPARLRALKDYADVFPVGHIWASLFWSIRQSVGRELTERALLAAWFEIPKDIPDKNAPQAIVTNLYLQLSKTGEAKLEPSLLDLFKAYNAPPPKTR